MEPGQTYQPANAADLCGLIAAASASGTAVEPRCGGSKSAIGRPDREVAVIDLSAFTGIVDYEPSELVLTVRPATPLAKVEALLEAQGQMLAFEPWDHGAIFGLQYQSATIGGVIAAGVAGPRRLAAGGARDHLLGFTAVSGRAEIFKAGGKVVKNVTGYDLSKVIAGSWGQLALMTELSIKVVPRPKATATLAIHALDTATAIAEMAVAMGSVAGPVAAAHLPAGHAGPSQTLLRIEGFRPSVDVRSEQLRSILARPNAELLDEPTSAKAWTQIREVQPLSGAQALWRIQIAPSRAAGLSDALTRAGAEWFMDWAGGLIWAGADAAIDVRKMVESYSGHAMLQRGPRELLGSTPVRQPQLPAVAALSERVKRGFDPAGILDPNRFA